MSRFIESLAYENGAYPLLNLHQKRVNETFTQFFPGSSPLHLAAILPKITHPDLHKVRVEYDQKAHTVTQAPYQRKPIKSLRLVKVPELDYRYKYADRNRLTEQYKQRGAADDIWIVMDGKLTDSYFANVCLWDGMQWSTPKSYLLNGVMRQSLIASGELHEKNIAVDDLPNYQKIGLINAMNRLGDLTLPTSAIIG